MLENGLFRMFRILAATFRFFFLSLTLLLTWDKVPDQLEQLILFQVLRALVQR
jgi:hypothetical protein